MLKECDHPIISGDTADNNIVCCICLVKLDESKDGLIHEKVILPTTGLYDLVFDKSGFFKKLGTSTNE